MLTSNLTTLIAKNCLQFRLAKGYSLRELAAASGLDQKQIQRVEDPSKYAPSVKTLSKIAKGLGCSIEALTSTEKTENGLYFTTLLIADEGNKKPLKISLYDGFVSFEEAITALLKTKEKYETYTAWVDFCDTTGKKTVYHACYISNFM